MPTTELYVYRQLTPEKDCKYCEKTVAKSVQNIAV